jgi:hypothetical protein
MAMPDSSDFRAASLRPTHRDAIGTCKNASTFTPGRELILTLGRRAHSIQSRNQTDILERVGFMETHPDAPRAVERRLARRCAFDAPLEIEWGSSTLGGRVSEISANGMFVQIDQPLWVGARFEARLGVQPPLLLQCTVRRVAPGQGMGVSFEVAEPKGFERLEALVASLIRP